MPVAKRYDSFTLNVSIDDVAARIAVASEDRTINNLSPGDEYEIDWSYTPGRPELGDPDGGHVTAGERSAFIDSFTLAWEGTVEGDLVSLSDAGKFPSHRFGHDRPNIPPGAPAEQKIMNQSSGSIRDEDTLFSDSTLSEGHADKGTASFTGWIYCDQGWVSDIPLPI